MPNSIGPTGLTVATQAELVAQYTTAFQTIYGTDIDLDSDTPDGQLINLFIQSVLDLEDLLVQINNMFDPDNAIGVILDQRVAINGIQRQEGTFSVTNVELVVTQSLNLNGIDQSLLPAYTVADNAGNQWQLQATQTGLTPGVYTFAFQAVDPGLVQSLPNTITIQVTIVLGISGINNPSTQTTIGVNEETDAALKIRRQKSVSLSSQGYLSGLLAALDNISGVTSAFVYENDTASTDVNGIPSHSIWVITAGTGAPADIAQAIYTKRNAGCGMFGAQSYAITQVDGSVFLVFWDDVVSQNLYIQFTATSINGVNPPNIAGILSGLPSIFKPAVNAEVNINGLGTAVQAIDPNTLVTNAGFSLSSSGPFTNTLSPSTKNRQFNVVQANIIITPMLLNPAISQVTNLLSQQFTALGGFGTPVFSILINNSGGSINSASGLYVAGSTTGVTDTVKVVDTLGNLATATVAVV